jgi:hypothetical protein
LWFWLGHLEFKEWNLLFCWNLEKIKREKNQLYHGLKLFGSQLMAIPRHSFMFWLVFRGALVTKVKLCSWGYGRDILYRFCLEEQESLEHFFFIAVLVGVCGGLFWLIVRWSIILLLSRKIWWVGVWLISPEGVCGQTCADIVWVPRFTICGSCEMTYGMAILLKQKILWWSKSSGRLGLGSWLKEDSWRQAKILNLFICGTCNSVCFFILFLFCVVVQVVFLLC